MSRLPLILALALAVPAIAAPRGAQAQKLATLVERILNPSPPMGPVIDDLLDASVDDGSSLRSTLETLRFDGCLQGADESLVGGLGALRALHVRAVERRSPTGVWRAWERKLQELSPDAYLLVTTWLDSPETAKRLFLCDDGLPPSWKSLSPDAYVVEAVTWFDIEVAEREHALHQGAPGDRELSVMELMELRGSLVDRYLSTYPDGEDYEVPLSRLEERLSLQWQVLVNPYHTGFTPKARTDDDDLKEARRTQVRSPFGRGGIGIPDPRDVAARDRVVRSWRRQRAILDDEQTLRQEALDDVRSRIDAEDHGPSLDDVVLEAARLNAELAQTVADIERLESRVRHVSTGRPWVDGMLNNGFRRRAVRRLHRRQRRVQEQRTEVDRLVGQAIDKGAMPPGTPRDDPNAVAAGAANRDAPGPGNWLAGLPGGDRPTAPPSTAGEAAGIEAGTGWVERVYEGPLPLPSATWSDDLVAAITDRHPELDETDARILLGLVSASYRELGDRSAVEQAVRRSLESSDGLRIRGEESTLSELWRPGSGRSDQPVVTFVLTLLF